jgi:hypothetical protein
MESNIAALGHRFSRRTMFGAAAAIVATPALAAECHIGPPLHQKGPKVFLDLDQVELDAAYDQAFYACVYRELDSAILVMKATKDRS